MDLTSSINYLTDMYKGKDWFSEVGTDQYGRLVVYIKYMCEENIGKIPDFVNNKHVLVHFHTSKNIDKNKYVENLVSPSLQKTVAPLPMDLNEEVEDVDLLYVGRELDRLEKMCSSYLLQDIFFEIHDGKNAVTDISSKFPDVRKDLETLYDKYGFDVLYEELDG